MNLMQNLIFIRVDQENWKILINYAFAFNLVLSEQIKFYQEFNI